MAHPRTFTLNEDADDLLRRSVKWYRTTMPELGEVEQMAGLHNPETNEGAYLIQVRDSNDERVMHTFLCDGDFGPQFTNGVETPAEANVAGEAMLDHLDRVAKGVFN